MTRRCAAVEEFGEFHSLASLLYKYAMSLSGEQLLSWYCWGRTRTKGMLNVYATWVTLKGVLSYGKFSSVPEYHHIRPRHMGQRATSLLVLRGINWKCLRQCDIVKFTLKFSNMTHS